MQLKSYFTGALRLFLSGTILLSAGIFSSCKNWEKLLDEDFPVVNHMKFEKLNEKDESGMYYVAGDFEYSYKCETYYIPASIEGYPVKKLGYETPMNPLAGCINSNSVLKKLYCPGSIADYSNGYIQAGCTNLQVFYCGDIKRDISKMTAYYSGTIEYYVPVELYDAARETANIEGDRVKLLKTNVTYRLNDDSMETFFYVDYVDYGTKIENVPPEPKKEGYLFAGWFTETTCEHEWIFDSDVVPELAEDEEFRVLNLFAKWVN